MARNSESRGTTPAVPLIGGAIVCLLTGACYVLVAILCLHRTDGHFTYALDDPYIHLAIAHNLADHGVWGVTQYASSSASSSPLWTVLIALAIKLGGNSVYWPVGVGIAFSIAATLVLCKRLITAGATLGFAVLGAMLTFILAPLHILPFTGMEHSLQILLDLLFGFWLLDVLARKPVARDMAIGAVLTAMMCLCRYESIFLVIVPFLVCLWRRNKLAVALALGPVIGLGAFGVYSRLSGMPWVPNSILTKGNLPHASVVEFASAFADRMRWALVIRCPVLGCLLIAGIAIAILLRVVRPKESAPLQIWLWTAVVAAVLHSGLAMTGIFYRYEAYLVVSLAAAVLLSIELLWNEEIRWVRLVYLPLAGLACWRGWDALADIPKGCQDIYLQQYQMARFVSRYYPEGRLAANDIGAVSYFSKVHLLDLVGLATNSICQLRIERRFTTKTLAPVIDEFKPEVIIAYPAWFQGDIALPKALYPVATWTIPPTTSAASPLVEFYAITPEAAETVRRRLRAFQSLLPVTVKVDYLTDANHGSTTLSH